MPRAPETDFRQPTEDEMVLLGVAVAEGGGDAEVYGQQLEGLKVRFDCECGCPSVQLMVRKDAPTTSTGWQAIEPGIAEYDDGSGPCWIILFVKEGRLDGLELAAMVDNPSERARLLKVTDREGRMLWERGY